MKKNILYIHGLKGSPRPDKCAVLQKFAEFIYTPKLYYRTDSTIFQTLLDDAQYFGINYIVGSSLGGLMGFWLAQHLSINALLFNPALSFLDKRSDIYPPDKPSENFFLQIVLGKNDITILPETTINYLKEHINPKNYRYELDENLGHSIDLESFERVCQHYLS